MTRAWAWLTGITGHGRDQNTTAFWFINFKYSFYLLRGLKQSPNVSVEIASKSDGNFCSSETLLIIINSNFNSFTINACDPMIASYILYFNDFSFSLFFFSKSLDAEVVNSRIIDNYFNSAREDTHTHRVLDINKLTLYIIFSCFQNASNFLPNNSLLIFFPQQFLSFQQLIQKPVQFNFKYSIF